MQPSAGCRSTCRNCDGSRTVSESHHRAISLALRRGGPVELTATLRLVSRSRSEAVSHLRSFGHPEIPTGVPFACVEACTAHPSAWFLERTSSRLQRGPVPRLDGYAVKTFVVRLRTM